MLHSHNEDPDPIHRGVSISLDVLCAPLGPPADAIPPLPTPMPGQTNRMRVDAHTKVFSALRQLGFRELEVKTVLGELRGDVELGGATVERLLREALCRIRPKAR